MKKSKFTYKEFEKLIKSAKYQFILKTEASVYFITIAGYESFNENGFVAHNESKGTIDIVSFSDILEVIIDSKKYFYWK